MEIVAPHVAGKPLGVLVLEETEFGRVGSLVVPWTVLKDHRDRALKVSSDPLQIPR
jgi:hypothetical protein